MVGRVTPTGDVVLRALEPPYAMYPGFEFFMRVPTNMVGCRVEHGVRLIQAAIWGVGWGGEGGASERWSPVIQNAIGGVGCGWVNASESGEWG